MSAGCASKKAKSPAINNCKAFLVLAEWTGLEPATPGVTGRYSNRLNYHSKTFETGSSYNRSEILQENGASRKPAPKVCFKTIESFAELFRADRYRDV